MNDFVSIVIPCRNEEKYIGLCLDSVLKFDYPSECFEILVVDGMSTDGTRAIISSFVDQNSHVRLLDNLGLTAPYAMNIGIANSKGTYVVRIDAHCEYPSNYVSFLIHWSKKLNAANVGLVVDSVSLNHSSTSKSIVKVLSDRFGVGNSYFRTGFSGEFVEVDTVPFGCYPRKLFDEVGLYDTRLTRGQDIELNRRITRCGGKIYLISGTKIKYFAADTFRKLFNKYYKTGKWIIKVPFFTNTVSSISVRHLIPLGFFLYLLGTVVFLFVAAKLGLLALIGLLAYLVLIVGRALKLSGFSADVLLTSWGFITLHFAYGAGSFLGLWEVAKSWISERVKLVWIIICRIYFYV